MKKELVFYFTKIGKKVSTSVTNIGKIHTVYAIYIELFTFLPAQPAASSVLSDLL